MTNVVSQLHVEDEKQLLKCADRHTTNLKGTLLSRGRELLINFHHLRTRIKWRNETSRRQKRKRNKLTCVEKEAKKKQEQIDYWIVWCIEFLSHSFFVCFIPESWIFCVVCISFGERVEKLWMLRSVNDFIYNVSVERFPFPNDTSIMTSESLLAPTCSAYDYTSYILSWL